MHGTPPRGLGERHGVERAGQGADTTGRAGPAGPTPGEVRLLPPGRPSTVRDLVAF
ncbi:hypothetical protein GCM10009759_57050 [Kitasatospora saccharophila]|uniref:Uncharacterized protein n=1 Tax=Kitasatospora saccharophila TaxID=407973 RepID=A0ABN2XMC0_9ACTN